MRLTRRIFVSLILTCTIQGFAFGASTPLSNNTNYEPEALEDSKAVEVHPSSQDKDIQKRLANILKATGWFEKTDVKVSNSVVFLTGEAKTATHKKWAETLANKTEGTVAVVNKIEIIGQTSWYMNQLTLGVKENWQGFLSILPILGLSIFILLMAWMIARIVVVISRRSLLARKFHPLLSDVIAKGVALFCFLFGLYIVLQLLGLTTIAFTILGGTGILGIILGIAFRDITENLLASVLLSVQSPFQNDDLIDVDGIIGYVQALTIRATILMTLDGHEVQIPNATVYKSNIWNFTSNPNRREDFIIGIGYEDAISQAQKIALKVLNAHPAVLDDPEPWILVETLEVSSVNLRIYFWLNGNEYHWRKVKSSVIRLIKRAFQESNISMPGQVIEIDVKEKVSVELMEKSKTSEQTTTKMPEREEESTNPETHAEGGLGSEAADIQLQARKAERIGKEKNLLQTGSNPD